jgi:hypothetical protein
MVKYNYQLKVATAACCHHATDDSGNVYSKEYTDSPNTLSAMFRILLSVLFIY